MLFDEKAYLAQTHAVFAGAGAIESDLARHQAIVDALGFVELSPT